MNAEVQSFKDVAANVVALRTSHATLTAGVLVLATMGCAATPPSPPSEPTRIIWSHRRDPQLVRFHETSMSCHAEAATKLPDPQPSAPPVTARRIDSQRQQYWLTCMRAAGYEPREVSDR